VLTLVSIVGAVVLAASALPAWSYPTSAVQLEGHGWGHGRGMGQYGSLGYAVDAGWSYEQILNHFYGGTSFGQVPDQELRVHMTQGDGLDLLVTSESPFSVAGNTIPAGQAVMVHRFGLGIFQLFSGPNCGGPWTPLATPPPGSVEVLPPSANPDSRQQMLQACFPEGNRWLRGSLIAIDGGVARTINKVNLEAYLRGTVPRESPASWGDLGGGKGLNALRAQAVSARSYARAESLLNGGAGRFPFAHTCNSTLCQVYGGVALQQGPNFIPLEDPRTDRAVAETAGRVRLMGDGSTARSEYSSSTGGYTAGGQFPAVPDAGDRVSANPNHVWTTQVPVAAVEAAWPQIGRLSAFNITRRNGFGDWGGRATTVTINGTSATVTPTGSDVRSKLGLKSDWFRLLDGYWILAADGGIFSFGSAQFFGSAGNIRLARPIVGMEATPSKQGYWLVASDGGIFSYGNAAFQGSTGNIRLAQPVVGMASTASGNGYWLVASDGGIFSYGDAAFLGSTGNIKLNRPVIGMAPTPTGKGYWLVASDGGIFNYGDAAFLGSTGNIRLNQPIVGLAPTATGKGYWLLAADGGIFAFGDAQFLGSLPGLNLRPAPAPASAIAATPTGQGYWLLGRDGGVFTFGDAGFFGSVPGVAPASKATKIDLVPAFVAK
jgi:SpoIID/LytB domain protein